MNPVCKMTMRFLFSHVGLFLMLCAYCCLGALLFGWLEGGKMWDNLLEGRKYSKKIEEERVDIAKFVRDLRTNFKPNSVNRQTIDNQKKKIKDRVERYHKMIKKAIREYGYDGTVHEDLDYKWTFASGVVFAVTTISVIGYGHIYPTTDFGRFMVIPYSLLGIPLVLMFLANVGGLFSRILKWIYKHFCCMMCRYRRNNTHRTYGNWWEEEDDETVQVGEDGAITKGKGKDWPNYDPNNPYEVPDENDYLMPVSLIAIVMIFYVALGTMIFSIMEGYSIATSTYFSFVTLTTIGFGDYVPGFTTVSSIKGQLKLVAASFYIIFGLGILGMGINVMIATITLKISKVKKVIGAEEKVDLDGDGIDDNEEKLMRAMQINQRK